MIHYCFMNCPYEDYYGECTLSISTEEYPDDAYCKEEQETKEKEELNG